MYVGGHADVDWWPRDAGEPCSDLSERRRELPAFQPLDFHTRAEFVFTSHFKPPSIDGLTFRPTNIRDRPGDLKHHRAKG
jgi:hypothetical protein